MFVKGQILRFFIYEFVLITGLNCFGNVDDFKYEDSSPSWLMKRLMALLRQEFSMEKQLYRLGGIPQIDKKFKDLGHVMNDGFSEILKSLQQKNEHVNKDAGIEKQSDNVVEQMQSLDSIIPDCFFKVYIDKAYANYYNANVAKDFPTQDASVRTDEVTDMEMSLINTIKG
ncbi:hypothetical protein FXO38_22279 [Capsicum annuum]|nr:hypothetical protein FXO38_22279 [Capsicum annuum]